MARSLPDITDRFAKATSQSLGVAAATEALWLTAPPTSAIRQQLKVPQLEALYESVYLRIFSAWENALEELVVYFMAGYESQSYKPIAANGKLFPTLKSARAALYGSRDFLLWHNPKQVAERVESVLTGCPVESVVQSSRLEIDRYAAIRHRVAHDSADAKEKFVAAAKAITKSSPASAGKMLRTADTSEPLNTKKWLIVIRGRLADLVQEMAT